MPNDAHHESVAVADSANPPAAPGKPTSSAFRLFGRGLDQIAWLVPVCLFVGIFLPNFALRMLLPGPAWVRIDYLRFYLWPSLAISAFTALALCWLLGTMRKAPWLFLTIVTLASLISHLSMVADYLGHRLSPHAPSIINIQQPWPYVLTGLNYGLSSAIAVLAAVKLPRRLGSLTPLLAAALDCEASATWFLAIEKHSPPQAFLLGHLANGLGFGLCLWAASEFQRTKRASADRLREARFSAGAYIFAIAFSRLLASLLKSDASVPEEIRPFVIAAGVVGMLISVIILLVFLHRAWAAIKTPHSMSPGSVVGGLFIPFFNLYWIFRAIPGFAREYQNCAQHLGVEVPMVPRGWLIAFAVGVVLSMPAILVLADTLPANAAFYLVDSLITICGVVTIARISDAVNRLPLPLPKSRSAVLQPA